MKLHYYPETDCLYIELKPAPGVEVREIADGLNADIGAVSFSEIQRRNVSNFSKIGRTESRSSLRRLPTTLQTYSG